MTRSKRKNVRPDVPPRNSRRKVIIIYEKVEEQQNNDTNEIQLANIVEHTICEIEVAPTPRQLGEELE